MLPTVFLAGANLGRPSSSTCISVSASPLLVGIMRFESDGTASGASSRNAVSSSVQVLDCCLPGVSKVVVLLLDKGTFVASARSSGCLSSAVGAGILKSLFCANPQI